MTHTGQMFVKYPHMNSIDYAMVYLNANRHFQLIPLFRIFSDANDWNRSILFIIGMNNRCKAKPRHISNKKHMLLFSSTSVRAFFDLPYPRIGMFPIFSEVFKMLRVTK